jgi:DNA-directed RNA polymerase specialized sigma24 family protein
MLGRPMRLLFGGIWQGLGAGRERSGENVTRWGHEHVALRLERGSRKAQVVELRFFGGLSVEETAEVLKVSPVTVMRDWSTARAWLYREMSGGARDGR